MSTVIVIVYGVYEIAAGNITMGALIAATILTGRSLAPVGAVADALLAHLSLLFVPVGVGVMTHLGLLSQYGLRMLVAIVVSTWIGLAVTALVLRGLLRRDPAASE